MTDKRARASREAQVELVKSPARVIEKLCAPAHHEVRAGDIDLRRLRGALAAAAERGPRDFEELLMTPGLGARTIESLALVAEVIHGAPSRFTDPARFSYAHGGKDGHPFPVPVNVYDETLRILRSAIDKARLGNDDRLAAIRRLDREARRMERVVEHGEDFATLIARELRHSRRFGGRTVFDDKRKKPSSPIKGQLPLFR